MVRDGAPIELREVSTFVLPGVTEMKPADAGERPDVTMGDERPAKPGAAARGGFDPHIEVLGRLLRMSGFHQQSTVLREQLNDPPPQAPGVASDADAAVEQPRAPPPARVGHRIRNRV